MDENKNIYGLKMASMIICGILGLAALIGIFWGRDNLLKFGLITLGILVLIIALIGNTKY